MPRATTKTNGDELVLMARTDSQALGRLYELYYGRILRFCLLRVFIREAAEDVTSEIFLNVARSIRNFDGRTEQKFRSWLYAIATNLTNAYIRKTLRRNELLAAATSQKALSQADCNEKGPEIDWPILYRAILQLKPRHQEVIALRFFERLPHKQIAEILSIRAITVRVTLTRALGKLRKILQTAPHGDK